MAKLVENSNNKIASYLNKEAFYSDLKKEIGRITRYGHRATFMLIELHISGEINDDYIKSLYDQIRHKLRTCDSLYFFSSPCTFAAILPDTHEGGGECAALRLKRNISQFAGSSKGTIATSIGLVSMGQETLQSPESIIEALKRDLKRDNTCQSLPRSYKKDNTPGSRRHLVVLPESINGLEQVIGTIEPFCHVTLFNPEIQKKVGPLDADGLVLVLNKDFKNLKKIQNHEGLKKIFKIFLGKTDSEDFDLILPETCDPDFLSYSILKAFSGLEKEGKRGGDIERYAQSLSAISASTHQLNQPLQIILGKIELLLLDLDSGRVEPEKIKEILSQIRGQILYSADINQKINRLTKI